MISRYVSLEEDISLAELARQSGLSKNTVYEASRSGNELPDHIYLGTLRKIAAAVNRRVVVRFEPISDSL